MRAKAFITVAAIIMLASCTKDKGALPSPPPPPNIWKAMAGTYNCTFMSETTHDDWHDNFPPVTTYGSGSGPMVIDTAADAHSLIFNANTAQPTTVKINDDSTFYYSEYYGLTLHGKFLTPDSVEMVSYYYNPYDQTSTTTRGSK